MILVHQQHSIHNFFSPFSPKSFTRSSLYCVIQPSTENKTARKGATGTSKQQQADNTEGERVSDACVTYRTQNAVVQEMKEECCVSFDLPGVKDDDILVELENGVLKLQAERRQGRKKIVKLHEKLTLDSTVIDTKEVLSNLEDGVLTLKFRKRDEIKPFSVTVVASDPPTDVDEGKGLFLRIDMPGVKSSDTKIEFSKGRLLVEYERKNRRSTSEKFRKTFTVNEAAVEVPKLEAFLMDGVLTVTAPAKPAEPAKIIKVTSKNKESQPKVEESDSKQENNIVVESADE